MNDKKDLLPLVAQLAVLTRNLRNGSAHIIDLEHVLAKYDIVVEDTDTVDTIIAKLGK